MKKIFYLVFIMAFVSCQTGSKNKQEEKAVTDSAKIAETTINIGGMHCDMCVASIEKGVNALDGIVKVAVSLNDSNAIVSYDQSKVDLEKIKKAIEARGYSIKTANPVP